MSKEVKRYVPEHCESGGEIWAEMQEDSEGGWVRASDYEALLAEREALRADRDRLREALVTARDWIDFSKGAVGGGYLILEEVDAALQGEQP